MKPRHPRYPPPGRKAKRDAKLDSGIQLTLELLQFFRADALENFERFKGAVHELGYLAQRLREMGLAGLQQMEAARLLASRANISPTVGRK